MDHLSSLAYFGIPTVVLLTLGAIWLKSIFKDVSLSDERSTDRTTARAQERAESLELQLAVAEDLDADPTTLNVLNDAVQNAQEDVRYAQETAERAREVEARRKIARLPESQQFLNPVAAVHSIGRKKLGE